MKATNKQTINRALWQINATRDTGQWAIALTTKLSAIGLAVILSFLANNTYAETRPDLPSTQSQSVNSGVGANTITHFAGYADVGYTQLKSSDGSFGAGKFAPIFHFQYRDLVMLEAELEINTLDNGETETELEYIAINWFINDYWTLVGGKFLSPIGQFRQNLHPSWINKLASAPPGFGHDGAAPVSDVGFQLRGGAPFGKVRTNYAFYISNGPELVSEFEDNEFELDGVEAEGFGSDADGEKTFGGRFAVLPVSGFELGLSAASGKATVSAIEGDESVELSDEAARSYDVIGADLNWQSGGFGFRAEYVKTRVGADEGTAVTASAGASWETWYTQGNYRLEDSKWELVARYTDFDSPHLIRDQSQLALGINYLFTNNFISKFSYEINDGITGESTDQDRIQFQLAYGF